MAFLRLIITQSISVLDLFLLKKKSNSRLLKKFILNRLVYLWWNILNGDKLNKYYINDHTINTTIRLTC